MSMLSTPDAQVPSPITVARQTPIRCNSQAKSQSRSQHQSATFPWRAWLLKAATPSSARLPWNRALIHPRLPTPVPPDKRDRHMEAGQTDVFFRPKASEVRGMERG